MNNKNNNEPSTKKIGRPSKPAPEKAGNFVQTERAAHEAWAKFTISHPKPSALLHFLVARLDTGSNAVVASHATLASIVGVTTRTIKTYLKTLENDKWIQVVSLGPGSCNAYVLNSYVAWAKGRDKLQYATFSAQVIASIADQAPETLEAPDLRSIPTLYDSEWQLPSGDGMQAPSQPSIGGLELDLPAIRGEEQPDIFEQKTFGDDDVPI